MLPICVVREGKIENGREEAGEEHKTGDWEKNGKERMEKNIRQEVGRDEKMTFITI